MSMPGANAVRKIRELFHVKKNSLTLREIRDELPELQASEISMALCYFVKQGFAKREKVVNTIPMVRKNVWQYTYYQIRQRPTELN
jgi:hypothetical protein